jgi:hypothetical protein
MIRFVPSSAAEPLSQALWNLHRPPAIRAFEDVTHYLFGWVDALDDSRWLMVDTEYEINVHADAELNGIAAILQPWIERQELPTETNTQLAALVESKRGQKLVVYDAFPQLFKSMSKTYEQMIDAGLLAEPTTL